MIGLGLGLGLDCIPTGGSPPPPSFTDFDDLNTEFWYSLNPSAARVSTVSFGSGVSQITGVNTGTARNATQATGAEQPAYNATGLNGFPCVLGTGTDGSLNIPIFDITGCAAFAVVQLPASYVNESECFGFGNYQTGNSTDFFAGKNANAITGDPQIGVGVSSVGSGCLSTATNTGVAFWFIDDGAYRTSWNGGTETTSSETFTTPIESWILQWFASSIKLGEFVILSPADSTPTNIAQSITILKSRWGIS